MSIADKLTAAAENQQKVYDAGYDAGYEAGAKSEYDKFWDAFQKNGKPQSYYWAFAYRWSDTNYKPKYAIVGAAGSSSNMNNIFYSAGITDTLVDIDVSNCTRINAIFNGATRLNTVRKLIMHEGVYDAVNAFSGCTILQNITVEGVIACDWNMSYSQKLTPESMKSIILHLKDYSGTDGEYTKTVTFTDECWAALEADSAAPDGGTWADYVDGLGWTI